MSVAIGIMAGAFTLAISLFAVFKTVGNRDSKTDVNVVAVALVVSWLSGGVLVALVAARLAQ